MTKISFLTLTAVFLFSAYSGCDADWDDVWNKATPNIDLKFGGIYTEDYRRMIAKVHCVLKFNRMLDQDPYQYMVRFMYGDEIMGYYHIFTSAEGSHSNKFVGTASDKYEVLEFKESLTSKRAKEETWEIIFRPTVGGQYSCQVFIPSIAHPRKFRSNSIEIDPDWFKPNITGSTMSWN